MAQHLVARVEDVPPGTTKRVQIAERPPILLCNVKGTVYAIEDVCTHDGGALDQGELEDCTIMCPRHGAFFDVRTGAALTLPAVTPVRTFSVHIENGEIRLET
ncbi:MAG TPA: non-heme iron oxygenase ferredoxin subunit [Candidatus Baltobacteraceae bacterium]|jgi:3-phenylpropionate/trans-cinnamate dioxygenase ferredoxin subunit|nr:non-heme iron oxygenase ferredoxin subunit [Candidatus Baltobacteraceae bacterium]